jgi:hypothetical protein
LKVLPLSRRMRKTRREPERQDGISYYFYHSLLISTPAIIDS